MSVPNSRPLVVFKIGGSLLDWPEWPAQVLELLRKRSDYASLLVIGGGKTADIVREWDTLHELGEEQSHWLALEALQLNEQLALRLLPESRLVRSRIQFEAAISDRKIAVLCANCFARWAETQPAPFPLPHHWEVTSDSIAAAVAAAWKADELVFVKSSPSPPSVAAGISSGALDTTCSRWLTSLPQVTWVDLRSEDRTPRPLER